MPVIVVALLQVRVNGVSGDFKRKLVILNELGRPCFFSKLATNFQALDQVLITRKIFALQVIKQVTALVNHS